MTLISNLCAKQARKTLRQKIRGSRALVKASDPFRGHRIANILQATPFSDQAYRHPYLKDTPLEAVSEKIVAQKIMAVLGAREVLSGVLLAFGGNRPTSFGIPATWRRKLTSLDIDVAGIPSAVKWWTWVLMTLARGTARACKRVVQSARGILEPAPDTDYSVLCHLPAGTISNAENPEEAHNFLGWFLRKARTNGSETIWAHVPVPGATSSAVRSVKIVTSPFPKLETGSQYALVVKDILVHTTLAFLNCLFGRWQRAVLLGDVLDLMYMKRLPQKAIARQYVFHNGNLVHKPLWTEWVETSHKASVELVFYSGNCELYAPDVPFDGGPAFGYPSAGWHSYHVWDDAQEKLLRDFGLSASITKNGPIDFIDSNDGIELGEQRFVAVFDVVPYRECFLASNGIVFPYYTGKRVSDFLLEIAEQLKSRELIMAVKVKREQGQKSHPAYRKALRKLSKMPHVVLIPSEIAARRLIESAAAVISIPFTSTALVGDMQRCPSVYYDSDGRLADHPRLNHGVPVMKGQQALGGWLDKL